MLVRGGFVIKGMHNLFSKVYKRRTAKMIKVIAVLASPRKEGNTDILLDKILEGIQEQGASVQKIILNDLRFVPCQECEKMSDDGNCLIQDDFQYVFEKIKEADIVILASPIFFGSLTAQAKMMIDRFQCYWRAKYLLKSISKEKEKTGIFLSVQATNKKGFFDNARMIVKNFFGTIGAKYEHEIFEHGIDAKGDILSKDKLLKQAFKLGKDIIKS